MTLEDLAAAAPRSSHAPVPPWTYGCFTRRSAVFADGHEDNASHCIRIQAHGLVGELRTPISHPDVSHRSGLHDCTVEELLALAAVDGGVADASWSGGALTRSNASTFQPRDA